MSFGIKTESIKDIGTDCPDLDLADQPHVICRGKIRLEEVGRWCDGTEVSSQGRPAIRDREMVVANIDKVVQPGS